MKKEKGLFNAFKEKTKTGEIVEDVYQSFLIKQQEDEERKEEIELENTLQEMIMATDVERLLQKKTNMATIYQLLKEKTREHPIEKLELVVTVESTNDVQECFVGFDYSIRLVADGEEIHKLRYMRMGDACFVSEIASRKRINALNRAKTFATYIQLSIESLALWGTEGWLPKQFDITEDIRTPKGFMIYAELPPR